MSGDTKPKKDHFIVIFHKQWDGQTSLKDKKILLWSEQGIGDTIILMRTMLSLSVEKLVPLLQRYVKAEDRSRDKERDDFEFTKVQTLYR